MKRSLLILCAASMSLSSLSFAEGRDHGHDNRRSEHRHHQAQPQAHGHHAHGHEDHRWNQPQRMSDHRGAGPQHQFRRGGRLPAEYRSRHHVVDNWRSQRLSAPPRGYHWVQTGSDHALVAIASGIIAQILLNQ